METTDSVSLIFFIYIIYVAQAEAEHVCSLFFLPHRKTGFSLLIYSNDYISRECNLQRARYEEVLRKTTVTIFPPQTPAR